MSDDDISYEPDDRAPLGLTLGIGAQGVLLTVASTALAMSLYTGAAGFDEVVRSWSIFAALAVSGIVTMLQAVRSGPIGAGHILIGGSAPSFIAVSLLALDAANPQTLALLIAAGSCFQFLLARWLPRTRQIITPTVGGIVVMLIAAKVMQVAVGRLDAASGSASSAAGPLIAAATVAIAATLGLRAKGYLRLWSPLVGIGSACIIAALAGLFDTSRIADAAWVALPDPQLPGLELTPGVEFWSLLPMFLVVSMAGSLNAMTGSVVIQQASWRTQKVTDFRLVQGAINANGIGTLLAGVTGTLPTATYGASSVSLVTLTGVAARRVGYAIGALLVVLAFVPRVAAVLLAVPGAVTAGYLVVIMGMVFVEGLRSVTQDGLQRHKAVIVATSIGIGLGVGGSDVVRDLIGGGWGTLLGDGMMVGSLTAIALTAFIELSGRRRKRLEVELAMDSLPRIGEFLEAVAASARWSGDAVNRLRLVGEEALTSLAEERGSEGRSRLVLVARPGIDLIEMQFLAVLEEQNLEEQLAFLSEQGEASSDQTISLHLLRHFASTVRHRKYSGIDIVTVEVEPGG